MSDFKTRLVEKQVQLEDKLSKLKSFIESDKFFLKVLMMLKELY